MKTQITKEEALAIMKGFSCVAWSNFQPEFVSGSLKFFKTLKPLIGRFTGYQRLVNEMEYSLHVAESLNK